MPIANGADNAKAQGQAIINTAVTTLNTMDGLYRYQKIAAKTEMAKIAIVKYLLIVSVMFFMVMSVALLKISLLHNCVK